MTNNSTNPLRISVIMPAYKAAAFIHHAIDSALSQTLPPHEIIVIDDGSPDDTAAVVRTRYGTRVRIIAQTNSGPAAARNFGIHESTGDWIAFLDSDDSWQPEKLERQAACVADGVGIVHCFNKNDIPVHRPESEVNFDTLWSRNYIGTSTVLMRKQAWSDAGEFDADRSLVGAEDYNLWLRVAGVGYKIITLREELANYTPAENSLMSNIVKVVHGELLNVERIAQKFNLPPAQVLSKQLEIWDEYGRTFLWMRDKPSARRLFAKILTHKPNASAFVHWMATFAPDALLNWKRSLSSTAAG